jgi:prolyl oligopeptidase
MSFEHDAYRWLQDASSAETRRWSQLQAERTAALLGSLPGRDRIEQVIRAQVPSEVQGPRVHRDAGTFSLLRPEGREHSVVVLASAGTQRVVCDAEDLLGDHHRIEAWHPSNSGALVAVQTSHAGREHGQLLVVHTSTGEPLPERLRDLRKSPVAWLPDDQGFLYVRESETGQRLMLHRLEDPEGHDVELRSGAACDRFTLDSWPDSVYCLLITRRFGSPRQALDLVDLRAPVTSRGDLAARTILPPESPMTVGHMTSTGRLYLLTRVDAARGRICVADVGDDLSVSRWREVVPESPSRALHRFAVVGEVLLVAGACHGRGDLAVHSALSGRLLHKVELPGPGGVSAMSLVGAGQAEVRYTDVVTPPMSFEVTPSHRERPPQDASVSDRVSVSHVECPSTGGVFVPVTLLEATTTRDVEPTLLTAYGGFGVSLTRSYDAAARAWVTLGGRYAIAGARGGDEGGPGWHEAGRRRNKAAAVDDVIAAAEWLVATGLTTPEQLTLLGGSNGALVTVAALIRRPDLFAAAVLNAPLVDPFHAVGSGLGRLWVSEYGDPDNPADAAAMRAYSPLHQLKTGSRYPPVLLSVCEQDTRVDPAQARKLCAALQDTGGSSSAAFLRVEPDAGHGSRSVSQAVAMSVDTLAFLAAHSGLLPGHHPGVP